MVNKFSGHCRYCGGFVPAGAGTVERVEDHWLVSHSGGCPEISSGLGIGGRGSDDHNLHSEGRESWPKPQATAGERFAPTGTTEGIRTPGKRCNRCRRPANWNPNAGEYLCDRHWDEY
jgi:hypothetical protein